MLHTVNYKVNLYKHANSHKNSKLQNTSFSNLGTKTQPEIETSLLICFMSILGTFPGLLHL